MREITAHKGDPVNDALSIQADKPWDGGATRLYVIHRVLSEPAIAMLRPEVWLQFVTAGQPSGITSEALLAVLIDRLQGFQGGLHGCQENDWAIEYLTLALGALKARTKRLQNQSAGRTLP